MKWIKASDRLPKEHKSVILQWADTKHTWRNKIHSLRDENGNVLGLNTLMWLDEEEGEEDKAQDWIDVFRDIKEGWTVLELKLKYKLSKR